MKLFCVLIIIVFMVVLGFYYTVMGIQTYNKVMKKYKKSLDIPGRLCYTIIRKGEGSPVSAEAKATEGPRGFPNQKKGESKNAAYRLDEHERACHR